MKLLKAGVVLLAATAATAVAMLATSALDVVGPSATPARVGQEQSSGTASPDSQVPYTYNPAFTPHDATWGSVFGANWR